MRKRWKVSKNRQGKCLKNLPIRLREITGIKLEWALNEVVRGCKYAML